MNLPFRPRLTTLAAEWTLALIAISATGLSPTHAATRWVPDDFLHIQDAVDASAAGDSVLVRAGTYARATVRVVGGTQVTSGVILKDGVAVIAVDGPEVTTIDTSGAAVQGRGWVVVGRELASGATAIEGFTLVGPHSRDAAISLRNGELVAIREMSVDGFTARPGDLAGGLVAAYASVVVDACRFTNCMGSYAGGISSSYGSLDLRDSYVGGCAGEYGGGVLVLIDFEEQGNRVDVVIEDCTFEGNHSERYGGGLNISGTGGLLREVRRCVFVDNTARQGGGGARISAWDLYPGTLVVERTLFLGNECIELEPTPGGGLYLSGSHGARLVRNTFVENRVGASSGYGYGAGLRQSGSGTFELVGNLFSRNAGGPALEDRTLDDGTTIRSCSVFWNNDGGDLGDSAPSPTDFFFDPLFCGLRRSESWTPDEFTLLSGSPCLPENNFAVCDTIGALGVGCEGTGPLLSVVHTEPWGREMIVDGESGLGPELVDWAPGSTHQISIPGPQDPVPGRRYFFTGWENGSTDTSRTFVAPSVPTAYAASFDSTFLLTMEADAGGAVIPAGGWQEPNAVIPIAALPDSGWWFTGWTAEGAGGYDGPDSAATVTMRGPIEQTAHFNRAEEIHLATDPPGLVIRVDNHPYVTPVTFVWPRGDLHWIAVEPVQIGGDPLSPTANGNASRFTFEAWDSGRHRNHWITVIDAPIAEMASFAAEHWLSLETDGPGSVSPEDGWQPEGGAVEITAWPDDYHFLTGWTGTGLGSYTGPDNPATLTPSGPIHQRASIGRISYQLSLSLSDTDPEVSTGGAIGLGNVYVWFVCGSAGGLMSFEGDLTGSIAPLAFVPAPGVLNGGAGNHLELVLVGCVDEPTLLGSIVVSDPSGGDLCLAPSSESGFLGGADCSAPNRLDYAWPADFRITGVRTDGGDPCASGRGCDETEPTAVGVDEPPPAPLPTVTTLDPSRPNPFSRATELSFGLPEDAPVVLSIYDVQGRLVRRLEDRRLPAGFHRATWDGRDSDRNRVGPGVYFVRLETSGDVRTRKIVRLR